MRRLSLWLSAHPVVGDSAIAAVVLLLHLWSLDISGQGMWVPLYVLTGLLVAAALVGRRRWPVPAAYTALGGLGIASVAQYGPHLSIGTLVPCLMIYTLVAYTSRPIATLYTVLVGVFSVVRLFTNRTLPDDVLGLVLIQIAFFAVIAGFCWMLGEFIGARRAYHAEVERRLRNLEFERDQRARIAVAEERNRIARELHDVLAHSVSVMITQADGAGYAMPSRPELVERALRAISGTGRTALAELRELLTVLRDTDTPGERAPQPSAEGLHELVDRVRGLGLPVRLAMSGDLAGLPTGIGLSLYRIVQESLTNTVKHSGPGTTAAVRVDNDGSRVLVEVVDDGTTARTSGLASGGNGLIGLRERAAVYGGTLDAGPAAGGGWRVRAELPLAARSEPAAK
ncbi:sensor histidine kinase [Saccharopolyspora cebuensis]|uniref:histidine kinase n=1 Tax=Saccharopolyspora cebuensis TaxID=418759 RepID=A0ABV4CI25_9PSEU